MNRMNERIIPRILSEKRDSHKHIDSLKDVKMDLIHERWSITMAQGFLITITNSSPVIMLNLIEKIGLSSGENPSITSSKWA